jgi:hypothetical protein
MVNNKKKSKKQKQDEKAVKAEDKRQKNITYNLFDDPMINNAVKNLTPEQIEHYKMVGKEMYGSIDFEQSKVLNKIPPYMDESLAYISSGLRSGILPKDLEKEEITVLEECYGKEWYENFGYTKEDLI